MRKELLLYYLAVLLVGAIGVWVPPVVRGFDYVDVCLSIGTFTVPTIVNSLIEKILNERKTMEFGKIALCLSCILLMPLLFSFEVMSVNNEKMDVNNYVLLTLFTVILLLSVLFFLYKRSLELFSSQLNDSALGGKIK